MIESRHLQELWSEHSGQWTLGWLPQEYLNLSALQAYQWSLSEGYPCLQVSQPLPEGPLSAGILLPWPKNDNLIRTC